MRRILCVLIAILTLSIAVPAHGHVGNIIAYTSYELPDVIQVRLVDLYLNPLEGMKVTASMGHSGHHAGMDLRFSETEPGTYISHLPSDTPEGVFELVIDAIVAGELFKGVIQLEQGVEQPEVTMWLVEIEPDTGFAPWQIILYGLAVAVVLYFTWQALKQQPKQQS